MTRSQRVGVRFDESFPEPPTVGVLAERLNRPVERVDRGPTLLFTDDPSSLGATVVVTTDPAVGRTTDATVVRWSHTDPPWAAIADALPSSDAADRPRSPDGGTPPTGPDVNTPRAGRTTNDAASREPEAGRWAAAGTGGIDGARTAINHVTEPAVTFRTRRPEVTAANDAFTALADGPVVGHPPAEDRLPTPVVDRLRRAAARARADERGPSRTTLTVDGPDGRRHYVAHDAPYAGGDRSAVLFAEVTDLKRSETQTAVLTRILRHNLRNEVTVARGYAERIEREAEDPSIVRAARQIVDATATLTALGETAGSVQSVLTETEPQWTTHELRPLLDRVASRVADRHPDAAVVVGDVAPPSVVATHHLERALVELAENAVLHGGGEVRLSAERTDDAARIAVADEGSGIPDPEWAVVAQRREITQLRHASGLGLWLVRWIVENNGGRLERREGAETCVVVHLPRPSE